MKKQKHFASVFALISIAAFLSLVSCAKEPQVGTTTPAVSAAPGGGTPARPDGQPGTQEVRVQPRETVREDTTPRTGGGTGVTGGVTGSPSPLKDVFFDYDRATITDEAKRALDGDVAWLRSNSQVRITVEGHCDERGTSEYNLALGDRRAKAVRDYLAASGIDARRIVTISYGKERPFNPGHDESAWKENRRAHFVINR